MLRGLFASSCATLAGALLWQTPSKASFPNRPMTMIVSYAAGGPSDIIARALGQSMSVTLGQPIIIENVAGAGGIGAARAAKAQPDGHTLLIHHLALAAGAGLYPNLTYDTLTAFEPIGLVNFNPFVLTSKRGLPVSTAKEAIDYIRANKDKISLGHAGVGSGSHLLNLLLQSALGVKVAEVAYRGTADKITAALEAALKDEAIIKRFTELGSPMFPEGKRGAPEAKAMLRSEVERWTKVIKSAGVVSN